MEPCEGLDLPSGSLIQLIAPVYGLNDAPLRWHRTLTAWLIKQGYRKSLLEPCLYVHYAPGGLILIEVDDLVIGTKRMQEAEFQQRFQAAFRFGKWENERPAMLADESDLYYCVRNSRKTESSHWMNLINSVHLCFQDPRRFWHNT